MHELQAHASFVAFPCHIEGFANFNSIKLTVSIVRSTSMQQIFYRFKSVLSLLIGKEGRPMNSNEEERSNANFDEKHSVRLASSTYQHPFNSTKIQGCTHKSFWLLVFSCPGDGERILNLYVSMTSFPHRIRNRKRHKSGGGGYRHARFDSHCATSSTLYIFEALAHRN